MKKADKYLLLTWKKFLLIIALWIVFVILHNLIFALLSLKEAFFLILANLILPIYFIVMIFYTIYKKIKKN